MLFGRLHTKHTKRDFEGPKQGHFKAQALPTILCVDMDVETFTFVSTNVSITLTSIFKHRLEKFRAFITEQGEKSKSLETK